MAVWERAVLASGEFGQKAYINPNGIAWVRILSPSFRYSDDVGDYGIVGHGMQVDLSADSVPEVQGLTDLALWLRGGVVEIIDSEVAASNDSSGNGNHAVQTTTEDRPDFDADVVNDQPAIVWPSAGDFDHMLVAPPSGSLANVWATGGYLCSVVQFTGSSAGTPRLIGKDSSSSGYWDIYADLRSGTNFNLRFLMGFSGTSMGLGCETAIPEDEPFIIEITFNASSDANRPTFTLNGAALDTGSIVNDTNPVGTMQDDSAKSLAIGNRPTGQRAWAGPHFEHVLCSTIPSAGQRTALREYLAEKYDITLS
jgi:hypothetical protein